MKKLIVSATAMLCLLTPAFAGPGQGPMYVMINGIMAQVTAFTGDVKLKNGCTVCMDGTVMMPSGKKYKLHEGEMLNSQGEKMTQRIVHGRGE